MGIGGLLSHCLEHRLECVQTVNLVQVAQSRSGIQILVDFYSFEHHILRQLWAALAQTTGNSMIRLLGGEYQVIAKAFTKLYKDLQALGITLVIFIDGAKGSCPIVTAQKLDTWKYRHRQDMAKLGHVTTVLQGQARMENLPDEMAVRPVLLEVQVLASLRAAGCEVVTCPAGEADYVLARNLRVRQAAFAILSNDSDFCIFKDSAFIPNELFDLENDLRLGKEVLPRNPEGRFMVGIIRGERVGPTLKLESQEQLIELSIIAGNDFTAPLLRGRLRGKYGLDARGVVAAAAWVRKYGRVENHPAICKEMSRNTDFAQRVARSRSFYAAESAEEPPSGQHCLSQLLQDQVRHGRYPPNVVSMNRLFYWHRMLLEDTTMSSEVSLTDLRSHIYHMVLNQKDACVIEYGRGTTGSDVTSAPVYRSDTLGLPQVTSIDPNKVFFNLRIFSRVMTHYEPYFRPKYFERYGRKRGFTLYVLRYFLWTNVGAGLHVTQPEFMALVSAVLGRVDSAWYQRLAIQPTLRAVTMGNWFQNIYRHAYLFLGNLLGLTHEFPQPWEIFSGAVWVTFYTASVYPDDLRHAGFSSEDFRRLMKEKKDVIHEHRHLLENVLDGFFPFSVRF